MTSGMTEVEAKRITTQIQLSLGTIADNSESVIDLIEQAKVSNAHLALGFESWTDYAVASFSGQFARLEKAQRVPLAQLMADKGMPKSAIAPVLGTTERTVQRDLNDGRHDVSHGRVVTRRNGSDYTVAQPESVKPKRKPWPKAADDAAFDLQKRVTTITNLIADERFPKYKSEAVGFRNDLARARDAIDQAIDKMGPSR